MQCNRIQNHDGNFIFSVRESIKLFRVRLGSVDCKRGGRVFPIISVQIHPSFIPESPSFDLALLKLAIPVTITLVINPIQLSMVKWTVVSAKFMTTYWPRIVVSFFLRCKRVIGIKSKKYTAGHRLYNLHCYLPTFVISTTAT